jgi:hypothetical protein
MRQWRRPGDAWRYTFQALTEMNDQSDIQIEPVLTADEMWRIPVLAAVAMAARAARLVLPQFKMQWPNPPIEVTVLLEARTQSVEAVGNGDSVGREKGGKDTM